MIWTPEGRGEGLGPAMGMGAATGAGEARGAGDAATGGGGGGLGFRGGNSWMLECGSSSAAALPGWIKPNAASAVTASASLVRRTWRSCRVVWPSSNDLRHAQIYPTC